MLDDGQTEFQESQAVSQEPTLDQGGGEPQSDADATGVEARAKRMGHKSKEEFHGDPNRWIDAETFVQRAEEQLPLAVSNLKRLNEKLEEQERKRAEQDRRLAEMTSTFKEFSEFHKTSIKRAEQESYEKARTELKEAQRQAVAEGDTDKFEQIDQKLEALETKKPSIVEEPQRREPVQQQQAGPSQPYMDWQARNTWYGKDEAMTIVANVASKAVAERFPHLIDSPQIFVEYDKELRRLMPDKFSNPRQSESGSVSNGSGSVPSGGPASGSPRKRSFNDLPADAKAQCAKFEKDGLLTREQYIKDYPW